MRWKNTFCEKILSLSRGVYSRISVSLEWVQQREELYMWLQWKCWQSYTHWTWHRWTSKGMGKDQVTARDKWAQHTVLRITLYIFKRSCHIQRCLYRCPPGPSSTPQQPTETSQPWMKCPIGWWRICQATITRSRSSMEISEWTIWYSIQQRYNFSKITLCLSASCDCNPLQSVFDVIIRPVW